MRRITSPIEGALMLLGQAPTLLKSYANELRALLAMLRLRLFETLSLLPPNCLESNFAALLRLLVSLLLICIGQYEIFGLVVIDDVDATNCEHTILLFWRDLSIIDGAQS